MDGRPLDVLEDAQDRGGAVRVRLKGGEEYRGTLAGYDQHMNLVLTAPEGEAGDAAVEDTTVIRGDNVVTIDT
jgi:small nuclear ribonucleoprotein